MTTEHKIAPQRIRLVKKGNDTGGAVVYWMTREQRVNDNWALLLAQNIAVEHKRALVVVFCFAPDYPGANIRHYGFMLHGLQEVEQKFRKLNIPFILLQGIPPYSAWISGKNQVPQMVRNLIINRFRLSGHNRNSIKSNRI